MPFVPIDHSSLVCGYRHQVYTMYDISHAHRAFIVNNTCQTLPALCAGELHHAFFHRSTGRLSFVSLYSLDNSEIIHPHVGRGLTTKR